MTDIEVPGETMPGPRGRDYDAARLLAVPSRSDGTALVGDMGGMPDVAANTVQPCAPPIERPPTLGSPSAATKLVGDMGAPPRLRP